TTGLHSASFWTINPLPRHGPRPGRPDSQEHNVATPEEAPMSVHSTLFAGGAAVASLAFGLLSAAAQEMSGAATTTSSPMSPNLANISQAMLDGAGSDAKNWLHPNGSYDQLRYYRGNQ